MSPTNQHRVSFLQGRISIFGIVALSVLTTLLMDHLLSGASAAQPTAQSELRAQRFVLVGPDGNLLAVLGPGADGNGRLQLLDTTGAQRLTLAGGGALNVFDPDGVTQRFRAGYVPVSDALGRPPINGVWLDPDGSIGLVPAATDQP